MLHTISFSPTGCYDRSRRTGKTFAITMITFLGLVIGAKAQEITFHQIPQNYQLYPRDQENGSTVPITGTTEQSGYQYVSVTVTRNNVPHSYLRAQLQYDSRGIGRFSVSTRIKAELANYGFKVYARKNTDSTLIKTIENVVSGDAFVIMGQSNATGFFRETETCEYCRTFGTITDNLNTDHYNPADTLWSVANTSAKTNVGAMGFEIQRQLSLQSGIPNCIINGGFHWSSAFSHAIRNETNPQDLTTAYGRMLYRVKKSGIETALKGFVYRQGETEAYNEGWNWDKNFDRFYQYLKNDLPGIKKFYVFQIDIIYYPSYAGAELRDYQRRLPDLYPDVRNLATIGTAEFDGLHYGRNGNLQGGLEVSRLISQDFYGVTDTLNINSPNIKRAFFSNSKKNELILSFDEHQDLVYPEAFQPNNNVKLEMKDFFYLNAWATVKSGRAEGNRVYLTLTEPADVTEISYLPPYLETGGSYYPFNGPFLKNSKGMRAFTFYKTPVAIALGTPDISAKADFSKVSLEWTAVSGAESYLIQRKERDDSSWHHIGVFGPSTTRHLDEVKETVRAYQYRIKAIGKQAESSTYGHTEVELPVIAGLEEKGVAWTVYPNPAKNLQPVFIDLPSPLAGHISLTDHNGLTVRKLYFSTPVKTAMISTDGLATGMYLIHFRSEKNSQFKRIVIIN